MEEELNENDLEERLYAMLHHVDETQNNLIDSQQNKFDAIQFAENGARSTLRRYWRTGPDTNPYQKLNTNKDPAPPTVAKTTLVPDNATPKQEISPPKPPSPVDLSIFQSPVPQNVKKTIVFLEHENNPVILESSDEDEVVEVALPPKPTITIESSDEDELNINQKSPLKADSKSNPGDRAVSASPVPSVVSSVSDEFIRGDCIALNISSRHPDKHSFDFSLHGSDLLGQTNASSKKKKRKKNKEAVTSTPIAISEKPTNGSADACFATPKSKAKNKKQRSKVFTDKSVPNPDVYDSDSNLCTADTNKNKNPYIVTEKSLPSVDVYESDSNQSEIIKEVNTDKSKNKYVVKAYSSDSSISNDKPEETLVSRKNISLPHQSDTVDLTENESYITVDDTGICDSIVIANVTGFPESMDYGDVDAPPKGDISKYVSSKVPSILNDNLDFDNLKGTEKICKKRRYSLTTLRAEMEKFYNESWGGEDFNHKEIQKNMSRDKSLWAIDPKDRMQSFAQRKAKCNYCNRVGHRDDTCRQKPPVCYMCGNAGHYEPRCPTKICVNCGAPNFMYSTMCRNCSSWPRMNCAECGQCGHPASHCPDIWRRYHNTTSTDMSLEMCSQAKKPYQQYCSGCAKRGHLIHTCRITLPFSGLPINSPHVKLYRPIYTQTHNHPPNKPARSKSFSEDTQRPDRNAKRPSKSLALHETHLNKKRNVSDNTENTKPSPVQKNTKVDNTVKNKNKTLNTSLDSVMSEKAPDFIPVNSSNHDNKGRVIQDNEVSDTSDAVSSARIYVTNDIISKLKTKEGEDWLKETTGKLDVTVGPTDVNSFLSITGKLADQEVFQTELREWVQPNTKKANSSTATDPETSEDNSFGNLPKNRHKLMRQLKHAFNSLNDNFGDPRDLLKDLSYAQNVHNKLKKQKVISPEKLSHSRKFINKTLKKLNIILVGQAGLAGGFDHLHQLRCIQEKLSSSREKVIPMSLRKEISEHYQCIFSSNARNDYPKLMSKYYTGKKAVRNQNRKKLKEKKPDSNTTDKQSIPTENERVETVHPLISESNTNIESNSLQELISFTKKIVSLRNSGAYPNCKTKMQQLLWRIHQCVAMLQNKNIKSKQSKRVKKVQQEVRSFLAKM